MCIRDSLYGWYSHRLLPLRLSPVRCLTYVGAATVAAFAGQMVQAPGLFLSLAARTAAVLGVYSALVLLFDARLRQWARQLPGLRPA